MSMETTVETTVDTIWKEPFGAKIFKLVLYIIIGLFGVIGNILVCIVVLKTAKLRSSTYYFICSLAVADIGVLLVCFPLAVIKGELASDWPFGETFCLYIYPLTESVFGASIWSITVIAVERYRIIVVNRPKISVRSSKKKCYAWMVIAAVWLGNLLLAGVPIYPVIKYYEDASMKVCYPDWNFEREEPNVTLQTAYLLALTIFWYVFPLGAISFIYWAVSCKIKERSDFLARIGVRGPREWEDPENDIRVSHNDKMSKDNKARRLLTPLVVVFAVTMFPLTLYRILTIWWSGLIEWKYSSLILDVVIFFTITNSAANPIIYTIVSSEFRTAFGNLTHLKQLRQCADSHTDSGVTNITRLSSISKKINTPKTESNRKQQKKPSNSESLQTNMTTL